jgi:hypothetical protein
MTACLPSFSPNFFPGCAGAARSAGAGKLKMWVPA